MHGIVHAPESASAPFAYPSSAIWDRFNPLEFVQDPSMGFYHHESFNMFPAPLTNTTLSIGNWRSFLSDGATIVDSGIANQAGILVTGIDDNEAATLSQLIAGVRITHNSKREVAYETRVKFSTIADTKTGAFFGLFEPLEPTATSHIADAGTMVDKNFIGFHRLETDGDKIDIIYKADGQTQQSFTDAQTLVADTFVKLGFYFDGRATLRFYLNGVEYETARLDKDDLTAATFPDDVNLAPALVLTKNAAGSTPGTTTMHWSRFAYRYAAEDGFA
jgi:hypothetical protein